jgi:hypothetical protein
MGDCNGILLGHEERMVDWESEAFSPGLYRLRKNALYEGHGFSRAALSYHLRALAPEVRLLRPDALKSVPQRLKPRREHGTCGTAEAVPFVEAFFRSL